MQVQKDLKKHFLIHASSTVRQYSVKILLATAEMHGFRVLSQDVTLAYLQSADNLSRKTFLNVPDELGLDVDELLELLKPL